MASLCGRQLLGLAVALAAAVGVGSADAQLRSLSGPEDAALREVTAQSSHLTAAVVSLDGRTRLGRADRRLVPLASTMKVLILDETAHEIAAGRLRAGVPVALGTIALTYLPGTDSGAHAHAVAAARRRGWVHHRTMSLRHVLDAMIEFSDNAATDTVLRMIDRGALARRARALGQDVPLPPAGLFISWGVGRPTLQHATRGAAYDSTVQRLARQLAASVLGWPLRATPSLKPTFPLLAQKGGDLPGVLTVVEGVRRRGRMGFVTALFFSGLDLNVQARLERDDAFDLVPLGIASRSAYRLRAQQALGLAPAAAM